MKSLSLFMNEGMSPRVAIIGSRDFENYEYARNQINKILSENNIKVSEIVSGGAKGADAIAEKYANDYNIKTKIFPADWSKGRWAGMERNTNIIKYASHIIAFWDYSSRGTKDSITKAQKLGRPIFIIDIRPESISKEILNEGVSLDANGDFIFDFKSDDRDDLMNLKYNKGFITQKKTRGVISFYSYKIRTATDKDIKKKLLLAIKNKSIDEYDLLLDKAILGLFNNPYFSVNDIDLIVYPESSSNLNIDLVTRIKNRIPNAQLLIDKFVKMDINNIQLDYDKMKSKNISNDTIQSLEKSLENMKSKGSFSMKSVHPKFRQFIINFLKINTTDRKLLNSFYGGKILVVDDYISQGTTISEVNRIIDTFQPKEVILYTLIA